MIFHSVSRALVVGFSFVDNLLIDDLVGFGPHTMFNLPLLFHRLFLLYLSLSSLLGLIIRFVFHRVLLLYTLGGCRWLQILELSFLALCRAGGTATSKIVSLLKIFFTSGAGPDRLQPVPVIDIFA